MHQRPTARTEGIVFEWIGEDLVVYDETTQTAHSVSAAAASVLSLCDGHRSLAEIAAKLGFEPALVARAVAELSGCGLLDEGPVLDDSFISRREAAKKLAAAGAAAFAAPMIYSVAIGPATAAASVCSLGSTGCTDSSNGNHSCPTAPNQCCSCSCVSGKCACLTVGATCNGTNQCCTAQHLQCGTTGSNGPHCCYMSGAKPGGSNCTTSNQSQCCSGTCNGNNCS